MTVMIRVKIGEHVCEQLNIQYLSNIYISSVDWYKNKNTLYCQTHWVTPF